MATQRSVCLHTVCNVRCRLQSGHLDSWVEILPPGESVQTVEAFCRAVNLAVRAPRYHAKGSTGLLEPQDLNATQGLPRAPANQPTLARFSPPHHHFHIGPFMFQTWRKASNLQPYLHAIQSRSLSLFRTFLLLRDFSRNKFRLDNIKAEDRAGWKSQFHALKENYPFSVSLQFCHFIVLLSWGGDKIWFNGNSGKVKFYDIGQFW